jgi:enoyl-CoA hydratase/carnithine racemase
MQTSTAQLLKVAVDGPVATLTMDRPQQRNALSTALMGEITGALGELRERRDVRAIVLAGEGPAFCAGHDLAEVSALGERGLREVFDRCGEMMMAIHEAPQPVIARVHGIATAAGCQLVAACDLAIAGTQARFATPGVKIGLFCSTPMVEVARAVGRKRALELLLTGTPIDAPTAADWGLVNRVVAPEELVAVTDELARSIASASGVTLAYGKQAFYRQLDVGLPDAYELCGDVMVRNALAADAQEGMCAFLEKRPPTWTHET